jgi:CheY-like chemotaxis protein
MTTLKKVLVVDDDPVVGRSFDRVLDGKGYAVIHAQDGEEALAKLAAESYDVVFTDIRMPGMSGLEVAEEVKARQPWLPVVIVTGYGTEENEARAEAAGVAGFLRKPLSPEMIESSAEKALAAKKAEPEAALLAAPAEQAAGGVGTVLKNVALFLAAPFIGLAYIVAMPFVGLGMLAWMGGKALMKYDVARRLAQGAKTAGMFIAAPFIGLAYIVVVPVAALGVLAWMGAKSLINRKA